MKKSEKTERTVSRIMSAAIAEFGAAGYAGGTVNRICKSGISKGLIYHNFADKDALYLACLQHCCAAFVAHIRRMGGTSGFQTYMQARMDFLQAHPNEAHIFFEAVLMPPSHLSDAIREVLLPFRRLNEQICDSALDALVLRDGVTADDARAYFRLMQDMLNSYFGGSAFQNADWMETIKTHETAVQKFFDYMIYGVGKERKS